MYITTEDTTGLYVAFYMPYAIFVHWQWHYGWNAGVESDVQTVTDLIQNIWGEEEITLTHCTFCVCFFSMNESKTTFPKDLWAHLQNECKVNDFWSVCFSSSIIWIDGVWTCGCSSVQEDHFDPRIKRGNTGRTTTGSKPVWYLSILCVCWYIRGLWNQPRTSVFFKYYHPNHSLHMLLVWKLYILR